MLNLLLGVVLLGAQLSGPGGALPLVLHPDFKVTAPMKAGKSGEVTVSFNVLNGYAINHTPPISLKLTATPGVSLKQTDFATPTKDPKSKDEYYVDLPMIRVLVTAAKAGDYEVVSLMTTVSEEYRRISHHGVRETLLEEQAQAIGIPLEKVYLPSGESGGCTNDVYEEIMSRVMNSYKARGVQTVGFGDLFLEDLRVWREAKLAKAGMRGVFPIWKRDTTKVAHDLIRLGYKAYLSCVQGKVGSGFAGRLFDEEFLRALPLGIDPCGENGEFHSFVFDGPIFNKPVSLRLGEIVVRDGRYYADLLPNESVEKCTAELIPPI